MRASMNLERKGLLAAVAQYDTGADSLQDWIPVENKTPLWSAHDEHHLLFQTLLIL